MCFSKVDDILKDDKPDSSHYYERHDSIHHKGIPIVVDERRIFSLKAHEIKSGIAIGRYGGENRDPRPVKAKPGHKSQREHRRSDTLYCKGCREYCFDQLPCASEIHSGRRLLRKLKGVKSRFLADGKHKKADKGEKSQPAALDEQREHHLSE